MNFLKGIYHYFLAWLGSKVYKNPSKDIFVIGVTGTDGKSTTIELINAVLEKAGKKTALTGSVRVKIADGITAQKNSMTMPGRLFTQRFLRRAVKAGCQYAILEVTSQGISQHRHRHINFDAVLVTNISPEHIEAHGSFEKYLNAKVNLFSYTAWNSTKENKLFFVNKNDDHKNVFIKAVGEKGAIIEFSGPEFKTKVGDPAQINDWLRTDFNLANAAAALAFAQTQNISRGIVLQALAEFKGLPGRMEYIQKEPFGVVVDMALTPNALQSLYKALKKNNKGSLFCILGAAGGGRDTWKRPQLGKIAGDYCDTIIISDDEPYDEDPEKIRNEIMTGIKDQSKAQVISDRKKAVFEAVSLARAGDVVVITGMGDLRVRHLAHGKTISWSDRKVAEEALAKLVNR
jgi:UDP-N-acetylmuramoyl-L-alanyl-D-glutamate--2,6-diaminopimelate ligase